MKRRHVQHFHQLTLSNTRKIQLRLLSQVIMGISSKDIPVYRNGDVRGVSRLVCLKLPTQLLAVSIQTKKIVHAFLKSYPWTARKCMGTADRTALCELLTRRLNSQIFIIWIWDDDVKLRFDYLN